jgi:hypothetical protein
MKTKAERLEEFVRYLASREWTVTIAPPATTGWADLQREAMDLTHTERCRCHALKDIGKPCRECGWNGP